MILIEDEPTIVASAKGVSVIRVVSLTLLSVGLALLAWGLVSLRGARRAEPLPILGEVPDFVLSDQEGAPTGAAELRGKVWAACFMFTRCPTICPPLTRKMALIQERHRDLEESVHLVSFSVDPQYDTPPVLAAYAELHGANSALWSFLTGPLDDVRATVTKGFKMAMGREGDDFLNIFHGSHIVLVDREGRIRAYYDSSDESVVSDVEGGIRLLLEEG